MQTSRASTTATAALLSGALPLIAAHGDGHVEAEHGHAANTMPEAGQVPVNYFRHPQYAGWMYAHIALMMVAWVVVLPPAIMLSVARSRYNLPVQVLFHALNVIGLFVGFVYNQSTPDLYVTNSHHPAGWAITALTVVWTLLSIATLFARRQKERATETTHSTFLEDNADANEHFQQYVDSPTSYRFSSDSGNFSAGSRANSSDSISKKDEVSPLDPEQDDEHGRKGGDSERQGFLGNQKANKLLSRGARIITNARIFAGLRFSQIVLEKFLLLLGFVAITTGFVVYGGLFQKREVFSGLAHYIKGGIFFWYGLLTLGRWMGAFSECGWAWNVRPARPLVSKWKSLVPSAEFTESFVIWLYGASNVFLEHLNNWGGKWSPQDFEHVSITILFFGGGLLGMLIDTTSMRDLTTATVDVQKSKEYCQTLNNAGFRDVTAMAEEEYRKSERWERPNTHNLSLNPMPALTIMFLGMMMSGHHQTSMVSTMMHAQWGMLFTGFAMARAVTYLMLYIKPPTSHFPSRPPSELVAAFCLTSGGILFMNSAHDSVKAIEYNGLDAMTIFTITIGLTGIIMAWELVCYATKGWAIRKEQRIARF